MSLSIPEISKKIKSLPHQPGCYLYKNKAGTIIYVGKAKDLRKRVSSYFRATVEDPKTLALVADIVDLEFIVTNTELEALFLEARLIKDHQPKYNIDLKAGTRYAYIRVTNEAFPRLETARVIAPGEQVFGPFASGFARQQLIRLANDMFKLRVGKHKPLKRDEQFQITTSVPPWKRLVTQEQYAQDLANAILLLRGKRDDLRQQLEKDMQEYSRREWFELARLRRDQLIGLEALEQRQSVQLTKTFNQDVINFVETSKGTSFQIFTITKGVISGRKQFTLANATLADFIRQYYYSHDIPQELIVPEAPVDQALLEKYLSALADRRVRIVVPQRGEKRTLLDLVKKNITATLEHGDVALFELQQALGLSTLPRRIECFDISNLGATNIVASMVVSVDGRPYKSHYRRFKMRTLRGQSDVDAMTEVLTRRFGGQLRSSLPDPDLVIVDGGKPQLGAAQAVWKALALPFPLVALAKQEEELFLPGAGDSIRLKKNSPALHVVQRVRDEAHRFAITYHRLLRSKKFTKPTSA